MNVGSPNGTDRGHLLLRESEMLIVVVIPGKVKTGVAKEHYCLHQIFHELTTVRIDLQPSSKRRSCKAG
jgi:hypothetical protein